VAGAVIRRIWSLEGAVGWAIASALGIVGGYFMIFGEDYLRKRRRTLNPIMLPAIDDLNLLILRMAADEARSVLAFSQFVSWCAAKAWAAVSAPLEWIDHALYGRHTETSRRVQRILWVLIALNIIMAAGIMLFQKSFHFTMGFSRTILKWTVTVMLATILGSLALMIVSGVPLLVLMIFLTPLSILAGLGGPVATLLFEITTESTPHGHWKVHQLSGPTPILIEERTTSDPALPTLPLAPMHSAPYNDPSALNILTGWLK